MAFFVVEVEDNRLISFLCLRMALLRNSKLNSGQRIRNRLNPLSEMAILLFLARKSQLAKNVLTILTLVSVSILKHDMK